MLPDRSRRGADVGRRTGTGAGGDATQCHRWRAVTGTSRRPGDVRHGAACASSPSYAERLVSYDSRVCDILRPPEVAAVTSIPHLILFHTQAVPDPRGTRNCVFAFWVLCCDSYRQETLSTKTALSKNQLHWQFRAKCFIKRQKTSLCILEGTFLVGTPTVTAVLGYSECPRVYRCDFLSDCELRAATGTVGLRPSLKTWSRSRLVVKVQSLLKELMHYAKKDQTAFTLCLKWGNYYKQVGFVLTRIVQKFYLLSKY